MQTGNRFFMSMIAGVILLVLLTSPSAHAGTVAVEPARVVVVLKAVEKDKLRGSELVDLQRLELAASELQKHIQLMTGHEAAIHFGLDDLEGRYPLYVGIAPKGKDTDSLAEQEGRWVVTPQGAYIYGQTSRDTLYAAYGFLQDQFDIAWIGPGDVNIVYPKLAALKMETGDHHWIPKLRYRSIRLGNARKAKRMSRPKDEFADFQPTLEAHNAFADDVWQWQLRMRMYGSNPGSSHAFSKWWERFGQDHPEYFALTSHGTRAPVLLGKGQEKRSEQFVKVCVSNPAVAAQLIADWLPHKDRVQYLSAGVDDGSLHFCQCPACRALDVDQTGEPWQAHLTDRYVVLANRVAKAAREHRPDAWVSMYAYLSTLQPPRREKLEPNVLVSLVPYVDPLDLNQVRSLFEGWKNVGAKKMMLRPNYHHKYLTTVFPIGIEKQMFDVFQLAYANGCVATDYDSLINNWPVTGMSDYVLARSMGEPDKPFEYWAAEYYSAYGEAADDVRAYFEYWRHQLWEGRLRPNLLKICALGGAGDFARGLMWSLGEYYHESDFQNAAKILEKAASHDLTPQEATRLRQLQLANEHARLTYLAMVAPPYQKPPLAEALIAFRRQVKDDLPLQWRSIFWREAANGDLTGMQLGPDMKAYLTPWLQTDLFWRFKPEPAYKADATLERPAIYAYDPQSQPEWFTRTWEQVQDWDRFRTDRTWENQVEADEPQDASPETIATIGSRYIGVGWYATRLAIPADWKGREIYLRVGSLDESGWFYVNGKYAGKRIFEQERDWRVPFEIRIDPFIDWSQAQQMLMVRVQNTAGVGGLWRRSWVVSK